MTNDLISNLAEISSETLNYLRLGSQEAYKTIYLRWRKPIYTLLLKLIGSKQDAEDITQDVFIKLWEYRGKVDPSKNIKTLLYLIARQSAIKHFEKHKAGKNYIHSAKLNELTVESSYDIIVAKELELLKEIALSRMPKQRSTIYRMSIEEGLKAEEIAEKIKISKESVYNQLSLARKDIKGIISLILLLFFTI